MSAPGNPTNLSLSYSGTTGTLTFTAPANDGGSPIALYVVFNEGDIGGTAQYVSADGDTTTITMEGLSVGTTNYVLVAQNTEYAGYSSGVSFSTNVTVVPSWNGINVSWVGGNTTATVTFEAPNNGGSQILMYRIRNYATNAIVFTTANGTVAPITVTGLTNGTTYNFVLIAENAIGPSTDGTPFPVKPFTRPGNPTNLSLSYSGTTGTLTFTAPADTGGSTLSDYFVFEASDTLFVGGVAGSAVAPETTIIMEGLPEGSTNYVLVARTADYEGYSTGAPFTTEVSGGGGGAGDPYVTTFSNISYKLPTMDAPIRYFQTMDGGKLLTVNVQLKTVERSDMEDDTLRSLIVLRKKMTTKQYINIIHKLMKPETLCFFERVSIQYGEQRLVVNLWDSKFELVENTLRCGVEKVDRPDLLKKAGGIYDGYKADTIKLTLGRTDVFLSVFDSPMIRNGIYVESTATKGANGVIVNALSPTAMTLRSLASVEPVSTRDSLKATTKVETFVDHEGLRSRNIVTYK
jgi:hypothetical protein